MADDHARQTELDAEWEALARHLAGESDPEEDGGLRDTLAAHPDRAALLDALDAALRPAALAPVTPEEVESALASVRARRDAATPIAEGPTARIARMRWQWRSAGLRAAAAVLVVAGGSMVWRATRPASDPARAEATATAAATRYATGVGRVDSLRLGDGTRVVLGPASSLVLGAFGTGGREVTLTGEAYFDVVHDATAPFVVHASRATLRDVGTAFTVREGAAGATRVAVTHGAVDVTPSAGGAAVLLRAGDRALIAGDGVRVERAAASPDELAWTRGVLAFHDAPLADVAAGLRRWFGLELVVGDSTIAARRLTATFDAGSAGDVGAVLAAALGGSASRAGDTLRIGAPAKAPRR